MKHLVIFFVKPLCMMFTCLFCVHTASWAQAFVPNLSDDKVPPYTLPDPLKTKGGKNITSVKQWRSLQRPYIYHLFEENVYGRFPKVKIYPSFKINSIDTNALNGLAVRKQITCFFLPGDSSASMDILLYLPKNNKQPVPVFVGLNFGGNHTVTTDNGIAISTRWMNKGKGIVDNKATDSSRGSQKVQWNVDELISKGYGLATAYYGDVEPDNVEGYKTGIRTALKDKLQMKPNEWSAMGAWAWGLCRIMDYLETDKNVAAKKVAVIGHSRLGKAALWAAASDARFAIIISNESGEGGAALSKRYYGETVKVINQKFPHWFAAKYKTYGDSTDLLPVDQHMLLALMAPRPLYVASADGDQWSDPKGEFLGAKNAGPVYALFHKKGLGTGAMPPLHQPVGDVIRYHIRGGKHDVTAYDWKQYIEFTDTHFKINGHAKN